LEHGKYEGRPVRWVVENDPDYVDYCLKHGGPGLRRLFRSALAELRRWEARTERSELARERSAKAREEYAQWTKREVPPTAATTRRERRTAGPEYVLRDGVVEQVTDRAEWNDQ
jgi:hypothetical protein